jgi:hypothetical protein
MNKLVVVIIVMSIIILVGLIWIGSRIWSSKIAEDDAKNGIIRYSDGRTVKSEQIKLVDKIRGDCIEAELHGPSDRLQKVCELYGIKWD